MIGTIWNIRGIGNKSAQRRIKFLKDSYNLLFLAILEPMHLLDQEWLNKKFGFSSVIANLNNKIWFYTTADIAVSVELDHEQFLLLHLSSALFPSDIYLSIVYAKCNRVLRRDLWENLLECNPQDGCPWIVGGDFNIIANPLDQSSGLVNHSGGMHEFSNFIISSGLVDAGFVGSRFTWTNTRIWKRLDHVLISSSWANYSNSIKVEHLHRGTSDHCPLLISAPFIPKPVSSFRFQNMWFLHYGFLQTVRLNWNNPCVEKGLIRLVVKLKRLKHHLKWWNQEVVFGNIHDKVRDLDLVAAQAEEIYDSVNSEENRVALSLAQANLSLCLAMEEAFWKQKASAQWMVDGEKNSKLFHNMVNRRRARNTIFRIWDEGVALETPSSIRESGVRFFENLLTGDPTVPSKPSFDHIPVLIDEADNFPMLAPISEKEVFDSVCSLHEDSAAGPDGFSADGVCHHILRCINNIWFSININGTLLGFFPSNRDLRQGDPLSPLLFVIAAEYLSRGLDNLFARHRSLNYRIGRPFCLSHLAYADDIIIFSNGSIPGIRTLRDFLHHYEQCSGQLINNAKSVILTSKNCSRDKIGRYFSITGFEEGSLPLRFLLQKYCRTDPPAAVRIMQNISASWRRMMKIRNHAESKIGWRIGDGDISFWFDTWYPDGPLSSLVPIQGHPNRLVSWFMDDRNWNLGRLLLVLPQEVAFRVLEVPIQREAKDNAIWKSSINGRFSIKSAWELESFDHLFFSSGLAQTVWNYFARLFGVMHHCNFGNWKVAEDWRKDGHARELIPFLIIWFIWKARNDHKHRGVRTHPARIIKQIQEFLVSLGRVGILKVGHWRGYHDVACSLGLNFIITRTAYIRVVWWIPPLIGHFKLNSDGCSKGGGESGIGGIVRNHVGMPIIAYHDAIGYGNNTRAELLAILKGLQICQLYNLFSLWLEVDSMIALSIIDADNTCWEFSFILTQIQGILNSSMVRKSHVYREANAAAEELANLGLAKGSAILWPGDIQGLLRGICRLERFSLPYIRVS
ncbi:uncharacterized protein [Henckelia pumila]|uniref:uncharacterized protein n=1 Tax=Henckelia pumila TaxID=405737 RepID=UPI003C6E9607